MALTAHDEATLADLCADALGSPAAAVLGNLSLTVDLPAGPGTARRVDSAGLWVRRLRRVGGAKLRHWGLASLVQDAELLISELVTNALRYGTAPAIGFHIVLAADQLLILVDDRSPGRPLMRAPSTDGEEGRGMFLVDAVASAWGVSRDETCTWCALTTSPQGGTR